LQKGAYKNLNQAQFNSNLIDFMYALWAQAWQKQDVWTIIVLKPVYQTSRLRKVEITRVIRKKICLKISYIFFSQFFSAFLPQKLRTVIHESIEEKKLFSTFTSIRLIMICIYRKKEKATVFLIMKKIVFFRLSCLQAFYVTSKLEKVSHIWLKLIFLYWKNWR